MPRIVGHAVAVTPALRALRLLIYWVRRATPPNHRRLLRTHRCCCTTPSPWDVAPTIQARRHSPPPGPPPSRRFGVRFRGCPTEERFATAPSWGRPGGGRGTGGPPYGQPLARELAAALAAKQATTSAGPGGYQPRTHHLVGQRPGGGAHPKYTNRLILESSPYLLQHAHNPVDWYALGRRGVRRRRSRLGKPVFLSVGYSTCHWCHVMEEESFEDEEIAALHERALRLHQGRPRGAPRRRRRLHERRCRRSPARAAGR